MVNLVGFCVFCVGRNVVLQVHILALKVGPCIFHSPISVIYQCTIFLPNLWLLYIYLIVLLFDVKNDILQNISPKIINFQGEMDWPTVV